MSGQTASQVCRTVLSVQQSSTAADLFANNGINEISNEYDRPHQASTKNLPQELKISAVDDGSLPSPFSSVNLHSSGSCSFWIH